MEDHNDTNWLRRFSFQRIFHWAGRVTASIGAATWTPEQDSDVSAVIRVADQALYTAKATGRNKVELSMAQVG